MSNIQIKRRGYRNILGLFILLWNANRRAKKLRVQTKLEIVLPVGSIAIGSPETPGNGEK